MFSISDVAPNGLPTGQTQTQHQLVASVIALQRVIAGQAGAESGDASGRSFSDSKERDKALRNADRVKQNAEADALSRNAQALPDRSAEMRSIVEAQEAALTERKITAAFQARHGLTDLLSVIRDPEDRMLPTAPES